MRSILFSFALTLAAAPLAIGCDKSGADAQAQANSAQASANRDIANATNEANAKINEAQAEADKKIAAARADFATTREDYRHQVQTQLDALDKEIAQLDAKAMTATGKTKADINARLPALKAQRAAFVNDVRSLDTTTATTWDATKARLDKEWADLKSAADQVG